ncbi:L,D-transpeptidase [Devosia sp. 2618]|uniref:L,D-transpeptidase n=1 Tax=Devosia sp. 2618 TaxID=3156454 RepID=UPI0033935183
MAAAPLLQIKQMLRPASPAMECKAQHFDNTIAGRYAVLGLLSDALTISSINGLTMPIHPILANYRQQSQQADTSSACNVDVVMIGTKSIAKGLIALLLTSAMLLPAAAQGLQPGWRFAPPPGVTLTSGKPQHALMLQGNGQVNPIYLRQVVSYPTNERSGTLVIDTGAHFLYFVLGDGRALRYGIGVAKSGFEWSGTHQVSRKAEWPSWTPPAEMLKRRPELPRFMEGGTNNPLGARALYLGSTLYRIHGTTEPWTIGQNVSSGCIRMTNADVIDLYERVKLYTKVVVL